MNAQRNKKTSNGKDKIMRRALICLLLLIMTLASNSYADVLIGDWETPTNEGWSDHPATAATGWSATYYIDDPFNMPSRYEYSYDWSTDGYVSLRANVTGWDWFMRKDISEHWWDNTRIEFDISAVAQDGSTATFAQVEKFAGSFETNGWFDMPEAQFNLTLDSAQHCVFDYAAAGYRGTDYCNPADAYGSIIFAYNADAPVYLYIDNIMMTIPEPATIGLLGLGGLALLRRKR